jgi:multiple sugar transport system ATP-binding protein
MASVAFDDVTKRFGNGVVAVRGLSLAVADHELVVLVGPSGCGKTTILRLMAGLEQPTSGIIRFGGRVVNHVPPRGRNVGMVFQRPALYPHLTVRDNLAFGLKLRDENGWLRRLAAHCFLRGQLAQIQLRDREQKEQVGRIAELLHLEQILDSMPAELSGGQQQRVALGRVLVREPALFLLDEPLSSLDGPLRAEMRHQLHLLHSRIPATMIYVTHDPVEALSLADRVVVLRDGVVEQEGRPLDLYDRPANRFVASFLGSPPMNFLDCVCQERDGRLGIVAGTCFLAWPLSRRAGLQSLAGRELTVGFRPEAVSVKRLRPTDVGLTMREVLREPLGGTCLVTFQREQWQVTTQLAATAAEQSECEVFFDMARACVFDPRTGVALDAGSARQPVTASAPAG